MKDSGIDWIGEIPKHWQVLPHKRVMRKIKHIQDKYNGEPILSLTMKGVIVRDLEAGGKMPTSFDGYQKIYPGNLLQCLFDIDVTPRCVGLIKDEGLTSPAYSHFGMVEDALGAYYDYLLRYMDDEKCLLHLSKNLRSSLTEADFGLIPTILPPKAEQSHIANFLDKKCAEIDELIALQDRMIAQLTTYKQAVITETVTKGLDPNVKMKDSGVEWIGEIPEHWKVAKLSFLFSFKGGFAFDSSDFKSEGNKQVVRIGNVKNDMLNLETSSVYISDNIAIKAQKAQLEKGQILFTMTGTKGKRDYFYTLLLKDDDFKDKELFLNQRVGCFIEKEHVFAGYYNYLFKDNHILDSIFLYETGTANQGNLGIETIKRTKLHLPPLSEQQSIANYLDQKCKEIDELISVKKDKIEKLKAYKKSMIYEYVTGKKQVN